MNKVYITACSSISNIGIGKTQTLTNLKKEKQFIKFPDKKDKFNKPYFPINDKLNIDPDKISCSRFSLKLLELIEDNWINLGTVPVFIASSTGGIKETEDKYLEIINNHLKYPVFKRHFFNCIYNDIESKYKDKVENIGSFSTACSSSGHSIMQAYKLIKNKIIDKAIIIGVDVLCLTAMVGFDSLKLVSESGTKPLTASRDGLTLGEGGGVILLESNPVNKPIAEIMGCSTTTDGYHISSPDPEGTYQRICINNVIEESGIDKNKINYVNAHGTGTLINDKVEVEVLRSVFDNNNIKISSLKAFIGHTLGASAITEIAIALWMLEESKIYVPKNLGDPIDPKLVLNSSIEKKVDYFLKNSFGFGGNNVSIIIKKLF